MSEARPAGRGKKPRPSPVAIRADAMAEIIKALWLHAVPERDLLDTVGVGTLAFGPWEDAGAALLTLLESAIEVKQGIVARDPRETLGIRTLLNLGHTIAHALELEASFSHGRAVAWGLACAAEVSSRREHLDREHRDTLWREVHPLLGARLPELSRDALTVALRADKKRIDAKLRSVLLRGPGDAFVVDDVTVAEWFDALTSVRARADGPVEVSYRAGGGATIEVEASKSIMNRLLVIAHLRPGPTKIAGRSEADDVRHMRRALGSIERGDDVHVGDGGTTYRFALAVAAAGAAPLTLHLGDGLSRRPHEALHEALRLAGAGIAVEGARVHVTPLAPGDLDLEVDPQASSQFASAPALLAVMGRTVTLRLTGPIASRPYFEMTLELLRRAGVAVEWTSTTIVRLTPTAALHEPVTLTAEPDASSIAVWTVARRLGVAVDTPTWEGPLQPDAQVQRYLWADADVDVERDLSQAPDLAPVLAAAAALTSPRVRLRGAEHLRFKESNRIDDLVDAFAAVGINLIAHPDGVEIPAGVQSPTRATFPTHGDHRLAMAACLLALGGPLTVEHPAVVAKSYPEFWRDAMTVGFRIRPLDLNDTSGRSPDT